MMSSQIRCLKNKNAVFLTTTRLREYIPQLKLPEQQTEVLRASMVMLFCSIV